MARKNDWLGGSQDKQRRLGHIMVPLYWDRHSSDEILEVDSNAQLNNPNHLVLVPP